MSQQKFVRIDSTRFAFGKSEDLVYAAAENQAAFLPKATSNLLNACEEFQTLREHAQEICRKLNLGSKKVAEIEAELRELVEAGLLVDEQSALAMLESAGPASNSPAPIQAIGIITKDRVQALMRCLESLAPSLERARPGIAIVVADGSESAETRQATRSAMKAFSSAHPSIEVRYAGQEEKRAFLSRLECSPSAEFAILDPSRSNYAPGANRNSLLLDLHGQSFLMIDDDMIADLLGDDSEPGAVEISGVPRVRTRYFADREQALASLPRSSRAFFELHGEILGRPVSELGKKASLGGKSYEVMRRTAAGRVRLSWMGVAGDSGSISDSMSQLILAAQADGEGTYVEGRRDLVRACDRFTISQSRMFMAGVSGYDATELLPPFLPVFRDEDGVFGTVFHHCFGRDAIAYVPGALIHSPLEKREEDPVLREELSRRTLFAHVLKTLIDDWGNSEKLRHRSDPAKKLASLGEALVEVAALPESEFEALVRQGLYKQDSSVANLLESLRHRYPEAARRLELVRERALTEEYAVPWEFRGLSVPEGLTALRARVKHFGELLAEWPKTWARAGELRAGGTRMSVRI